jgi:cell division protein FtsI (penicillin-binding protein 3)
MLGRTDSRLRLVLLLGIFAIVATLLGVRLAYWQIGQGDELRRIASSRQLAPHGGLGVERGQITDRRGDILATTAYRDLLAAYPDLMTPDERTTVAARLAHILGMSDAQAADLRQSFKPDRPYVIVARRLTERQSDQVRAGLANGELNQLALEPHAVRFYPSTGGSPDTTLASQLLGFVTEDGQGRYGIEQASQDVLAGDLGATASADGSAALPTVGGSVQLTIDASLQLRLEKELYAAWVADRAKRVTGLVLDPYTGAVLAWASVPGYDANDYADTAERSPGLFADPLYSQIYEPGSVMKMFTAATAIEEGVLTLDTPVLDERQLRLGSSVVENFDRKGMGIIPFEDAIAHSRNVATGHVALSLADTVSEASAKLYGMWQRLGLGRLTGIELPGESAGIVADPAQTRWQAIDLVNRSFGQAVAITPLQLATAFAAMVNGGTLPHPHVYQAIDGQPVSVPAGDQVISGELSDTLRQLMIHVVDAGPHYAVETQIAGYVVGGKTGTAQIWDSRSGQWLDRIYNHTFVGFVGAERPAAIILVRIHDTQPRVHRRWGMTLEMTTNELFRRVALDTIDVLDIPPLSGSATSPAPTEGDPATEPTPAIEEPPAEPQPMAAGR